MVTAADFLLDAKMNVEQIEAVKKDVQKLLPRVKSGGQEARLPLAHALACMQPSQ